MMKLSQLLSNIDYIGQFTDADIDFVCDDSRKIKNGCVYVAVKGASFDGHTYAQKAIENGACIVVGEHDMGIKSQIIVSDSRKAYALMCANLFENPAQKLKLIGITGTNGKTTTAFLIKNLLELQGKKVGLMGTVQNMIGLQVIPAKFTTPQSYELHALLSQMLKSGCEYVVMEASSQALAQDRLYGIEFDVGIFTNLTVDHLDYHKTMENYFDAKCILFKSSKMVVSNIDDNYGKLVAEKYNGITYSFTDENADFYVNNADYTQNGVEFSVKCKSCEYKSFFRMPGRYSLQNVLGAIIACREFGFEEKQLFEDVTKLSGVKGRCEVIADKPFTVIRDFAHTTDGLENLLSSLKPFSKNRMIVLFGCAGQRDPSKRPDMGRAVAKYADYAFVTSDNPRKEDEMSIIDSVLPYLREKDVSYSAITDRRACIYEALDMCHDGDLLVLCGKGHEDYQALSGYSTYLDEKDIVEKYFADREKQ